MTEPRTPHVSAQIELLEGTHELHSEHPPFIHHIQDLFRDVIPQNSTAWKEFFFVTFPTVKLVLSGEYSWRQLLVDASSGIAVGVMLVSQCVAYRSIALVPATILLNAAFTSTMVYSFLGQTPVGIGPAAETLLMVAQQTSSMSEAERALYSQYIALQVGFLSIVLACVFGGTILATSMPQSVSKGYTTAAAFLVILSQIKPVLNLKCSTGTTMQEMLGNLFAGMRDTMTINSLYCLLLFCGYVIYLEAVRKVKSLPAWIPHALIIIATSTLISYFGKFETNLNLEVLGPLPGGFPPLSTPNVFSGFGERFQFSIVVVVVAFLQSFSVATMMNPTANPNQELFALGIKDIACGISTGTTCAAGLGRSALYRSMKCTPIALFFSSLVVLLCLVVFAPLNVFYHLPAHATAAIIVSAMCRMFDYEHPVKLWRIAKADFLIWLGTVVMVLFVGIAAGIAMGIVMSLIIVVLRIAKPRGNVVGFSDMTYSRAQNASNRNKNLKEIPNVFCWRFEAPLYYINMYTFRNLLVKAIAQEQRPITAVLVVCTEIEDMDLTGAENFLSVLDPLRAEGIRVVYGGIHGRILRKLRLVHTHDALDGVVFKEIRDAVLALKEDDACISVMDAEATPLVSSTGSNIQDPPINPASPNNTAGSTPSQVIETMRSFKDVQTELQLLRTRTQSMRINKV